MYFLLAMWNDVDSNKVALFSWIYVFFDVHLKLWGHYILFCLFIVVCLVKLNDVDTIYCFAEFMCMQRNYSV